MATSKAVAKTADALPAYLKDVRYEQENSNFTAEDVTIPQIKLLQGLSDQISQFDNANVGDFWHTGMDESLGNSIQFIVCSRRRKYLLVTPQDDGRGVLARADDGAHWDRAGKWEVKVDKKTTAVWEIQTLSVADSGLTDWGTYDPSDPESPPAATLFYEYLVVLPARLDLGPAVISLARSQVKKAKKGLNDKIMLHASNGRPLQALMFEASSVEETNASGQQYHNWKFTGAGFVQEEAVYQQAVDIGERIKTYAVQDEAVVEPVSTTDDEDAEEVPY